MLLHPGPDPVPVPLPDPDTDPDTAPNPDPDTDTDPNPDPDPVPDSDSDMYIYSGPFWNSQLYATHIQWFCFSVRILCWDNFILFIFICLIAWY